MPDRRTIPRIDHRKHFRRASNGCWLWKGALANGYACVRRGGRLLYVGRMLWEEIHGPIPKGRILGRTCHERTCVNPEHGELTTYSEAARQGQLRRWHS